MKKEATIMDTVHPNLLEPPHYVGELIRFIAGEWLPDPSQQEQLVAHLITCSYCRIALITLVAGEQKDKKGLNASSETVVRDLFMQFVTIHHTLEALAYECIGAYAETIVTTGKVLADQRFSVLAEHMKRCLHCHLMLEEMLAFLNEPEETC